MAQGKTVGPERGREERPFSSQQNSSTWERVGAEPGPRDSSCRDSGGLPQSVSQSSCWAALKRALIMSCAIFEI